MINSKQKGNQGERDWAKFLREQNLDKRAWRNYGSGSTTYKSDVVNKLDYNFEVKCVKHLNLGKAIKQTKRDAEMSGTKPSVIMHLDGMKDGEWWILIDAYEWANLIKRNEEPKIKEPDRELKYELIRLKNSIQKIIKMIE
jgi:Holliday junction resolvase